MYCYIKFDIDIEHGDIFDINTENTTYPLQSISNVQTVLHAISRAPKGFAKLLLLAWVCVCVCVFVCVSAVISPTNTWRIIMKLR